MSLIITTSEDTITTANSIIQIRNSVCDGKHNGAGQAITQNGPAHIEFLTTRHSSSGALHARHLSMCFCHVCMQYCKRGPRDRSKKVPILATMTSGRYEVVLLEVRQVRCQEQCDEIAQMCQQPHTMFQDNTREALGGPQCLASVAVRADGPCRTASQGRTQWLRGRTSSKSCVAWHTTCTYEDALGHGLCTMSHVTPMQTARCRMTVFLDMFNPFQGTLAYELP